MDGDTLASSISQNAEQASKIADTFSTPESTTGDNTKNQVPAPKRFWKNAKARADNHNIHIELDGRPLRTPLGQKLRLPLTKPTLGALIAQEWDGLVSLKVKPHALPLTGLASRAIDLEESAKKYGPQREINLSDGMDRAAVSRTLIPYLDTDTLLVFAPKEEYYGKLRQAQEEQYRPVIQWFEEKFTDGDKLIWLDGDNGILGGSQTSKVTKLALKYLDSLDYWQFAAFERTVLSARSFIAGALLVEGKMESRDIAALVSLENEFQTKRWGHIEEHHDVEWANLRRQLASAAVLIANESKVYL
ncbi:hypothetical protein CANCADRAFT_44467 [Tortispora caseinolytica NRRL Y-17796]|uniref:ATP synthase mitochondrial F1 complex assembly factor 2 n=1 Tax=Tortispora caseinolytica NRRL Y-17796 TaxID=767744 RepID=A0A1E4TGD3_9ASCO|nr:hypothetical protein CANCADRAFT_44467 [Tortispora caseinolytica NRRL Y-17796]